MGGSIMRVKWYLFIIILFSSALRCMEVPIPEEEEQGTIKIKTGDEKVFKVLVVVAKISATMR